MPDERKAEELVQIKDNSRDVTTIMGNSMQVP